jgi:FkbM family methyltransferase
VSLRVRALGGARVLVRPGSSDAQVLLDTFVGGYHRPPADLDPTTIVDLGSNIGLTLADLAAHHRRATLVGVELDEDNAALAEMNVEAWRERCTVVRAAVWIDDGEVTYELTPGREYAARIGDGDRTTRSISIDTLTAGLPKVDYLKMDIEGAEAQVLRANTDWAAKVASIKVETHPPYTRDDCTRDLTALGFIVVVDPHHTRAVLGRRGQSGGR